MSISKTVIVAGHICLDVLPEMDHLPYGVFEKLFRPGQLISVGEAVFVTGGPVSNVGLALHKLGIPTRLIAKIGNDNYGSLIQKIIAGFEAELLEGIQVDMSHPTSYSIIISPPGADRLFLHCPGVNDVFQATDIDPNLVAEADLMHFGYPPVMRQMYQAGGAELVQIFQEAKQAGITTSLDMALPDPTSLGGQANWHRILSVVLPYVDIFTPSIKEILFMLHRKQFDELVSEHRDILDGITPTLLSDLGAELIDMGARVVLLKLGHHGAFLRTTNLEGFDGFGRATPNHVDSWVNQELWSACYQVDVMGTTGSGDATISGLLSAILRQLSPQDALNAAVAVGACNVESPDAISGVCSWEVTMKRIQDGWTKLPLNLGAPGWDWDQSHDMWIKSQE
jgi:sugar/nucleoside kinase (ribokinase family)